MLHEQAIEVIQFEYNSRWIDSRHFLKDAFDYLRPFEYRIGKITPKGVEFYQSWHPELETFREGNYLACRGEWFKRFTKIKWWNEIG